MKARFSFAEQELGHKIWSIVELFYRAQLAFREQFESYEGKVLQHSRKAGIRREDLRLNSAELAGLLDLKSLERMRDGYLYQLKDLCHLVFRGQDRTDLLDRYVSDIFHEISILKEEHYNVKTYAPLYERDAAEVELKHILDEAHAIFPKELSHIRYLFGRAQARLEEHLAAFRGVELFVRSLYLHRGDFVKDAYPEGLERFYTLMYPLGSLEGYAQVAASFYHAGFLREALEAYRLARAANQGMLAGGPPRTGAAGAPAVGTPAPGTPAAEGPASRGGRERARALVRLVDLRIERLERLLGAAAAPAEAAGRAPGPGADGEAGPRDGGEVDAGKRRRGRGAAAGAGGARAGRR